MQVAQGHVDKLVRFLTSNVKLSQGHMVDFFTQSLYASCLPVGVCKEIETIGFEETINLILGVGQSDHGMTSGRTPLLAEFIHTAKSFSLYNSNLCKTRAEFFHAIGLDDATGLKLDVFMKSKKAHEVETLSEVAVQVAAKCRTTHLVDIGDGKGYLSSLIAFQHQMPVLGVDGSLVNTEGAVRRAKLLEKHWLHITTKKNIGIFSKEKDNGTCYKQITKLVTTETDFDQLVEDVFLDQPNGLGLIGLHTCGNLGPTSIRIFNANPNIKSICNVSCCYHLLNERYLANSAMGFPDNEKPGFPMSAYLAGRGFTMLRSTRMLAAVSLDRLLHGGELPSKVIFYRALYEVVLERQKVSPENGNRNVGRFRRQPDNFAQYVREASKKLGIAKEMDIGVSNEELEALYEEYLPRRKELNVFQLIRSMLSPAIEALILCDRYLYLLEQGHTNVHLIKLFDPVISPRCYGLVSMRC